MKYILILLIFLSQFIDLSAKEKKKGSDYVKITPMVSHTEVIPGSQVMLIFDFKMEKDWHIYWKNPGDSGLPTEIKVEAEKPIDTLQLFWYPPEKFTFDDLVNYGYSDSVRLVYLLIVPKTTKEGTYKVKATVNYLACKEECLAGKETFELNFKVSGKTFLNTNLNELNMNNYYHDFFNRDVGNSVLIEDTLYTELSVYTDNSKYYAEFFPLSQGYFVYSGIKIKTIDNDRFAIILPLDKFREEDPKELKGLVIFRNYSDHKLINSLYIDTKIKK